MAFKDIDFVTIPQTALRVIKSPADFFKVMPKSGGYFEPFVFAVCMGLVAGIIQLFWRFLGFGFGSSASAGMNPVVSMLIASVIGTFIGAAIFFVIWKLMGSRENYETSFRCMAYFMALAPVTAIFSVIPYFGTIINMAIFVYYIVAASTNVHNIATKKSWLVFGIIGVILAVFNLRGEYNLRNMSPDEQSKKAAVESADAERRKSEELRELYERQLQQNK
jgi:hypothetical protein